LGNKARFNDEYPPSKVGERIRWDIIGMSEDEKDEAELLWLEARKPDQLWMISVSAKI
jgi:hypothetical protein